MDEKALVQPEVLLRFCTQALTNLGVVKEDADITANVLVAADLRGIESHGVLSLERYIDYLISGFVVPKPTVQILNDSLTTQVLDGGAGLGQPLAFRAMQTAIEKALSCGAGFVAVRNSNHYGIAGYYAMQALEHGCVGFSTTNAGKHVIPTFGNKAMFGTNPIAVAAPAGREMPFVLDMSTSVAPVGKIVAYKQQGKPIPQGWGVDETTVPVTDAKEMIDRLEERSGGGLLPLGGLGELLGGHKGFGLALLVEIFSGILSGSAYADLVYPVQQTGQVSHSGIGHFFGAWRVDCFRPLVEFKASMDDLQRRIKDSPKAPGQARIYIPGEKEFEQTEQRRRNGLPISPGTLACLRSVAEKTGIALFDLHAPPYDRKG